MARKDLIVVIAGDNSDLLKKLRQVKQDFAQLGQDLSNIGAKLSAAVTLPLLAAGGAALKLAGDYEQAEIAFTTMLGSAEKAKSFLQELEEFAKKTPFDFPGLVDASRRLIAMGFEADRVIPILTAVGDAAAATGTGAVGVDRITKALSQMAAKGKVSAEEMTQQLGEIIPAWQMLADEIGVSVPEAMKMAEQGMLDGASAVDAIVRQMAANYGGTMEKQMTTLTGLFDRAKDTLLMSLRDIGVALTPLAKQIFEGVFLPMLSGIEKAVEGFAKLPSSIQMGVAALAVLAGATGPVLFAIGQISLGMTAILSLKGPLLALFTTTIPAGIAAIANLGRALVLLSASYIVPLIASLASLRAGFMAFVAALASGNIAGALAMAQGALAGFAATIGTVLIPALAAAALAFGAWNLGKWAADNIPILGRLGDAFASFVVKLQQFTGTGAWGQAAQASQELQYQVTKLAEELEKKGVVVERGAMSISQWHKALWEAAQSAGVASVATNDVAKAMALLDTLTKNSGDTAKAAMDALAKALKEGAINQDTYNKYLAKYNSLADGSAKKTKELKKTLAELVAAGEVGVVTWSAQEIALMAYESAVDEGKESVKELSKELTNGNRSIREQGEALAEVVQGWYKVNPELAEAVAKMTAMKPALSGVNTEALKAADNGKKFSEAFNAGTEKIKQLRAELAWIGTQLDNQNLGLEERTRHLIRQSEIQDEINGLLGVQKERTDDLAQVGRAAFRAFQDMGFALRDALMGGKQLFQDIGGAMKQLAADVIDIVIQGALNKMKDAILEQVQSVDVLRNAWKKLGDVLSGGGGGDWKTPGALGGDWGGKGSGSGAGGLAGIIGMVTGIAQTITGIFQSFQFAAMNKTLDLIEREVRESKIHLSYILGTVNDEFHRNVVSRQAEIVALWNVQLEKMGELIAAVKGMRLTPGSTRGQENEEPVSVLVDWAAATRAYVSEELLKAKDALLVPLNLIRQRLDDIHANTLTGLIVPELERQSGILTSIYGALSMGETPPVVERIPNLNLGDSKAKGLTVNISGAMKKGQYVEMFTRELEAFGIPD